MREPKMPGMTPPWVSQHDYFELLAHYNASRFHIAFTRVMDAMFLVFAWAALRAATGVEPWLVHALLGVAVLEIVEGLWRFWRWRRGLQLAEAIMEENVRLEIAQHGGRDA